MLAIHGVWAHGALYLWAEESRSSAAGRAARDRSAVAPRAHPYGCAPDLLADVLAEFGDPISDLARKAAQSELTLWLPTGPTAPLASPELQSADPAADGSLLHRTSRAERAKPGTPELADWQVPALSFEPAAALVLLLILSQLAGPGQPPLLGASVQYLAALAALAADLTARGRVLPGLDSADDGSYAARWRPVLSGADALRARELTAAMPPLCRSASAAGEPSASIVTAALELLTDAAVRARMRAAPGFALLPDGAASPASPLTERWADALTADSGMLEVSRGETALAAQLAFALWAWQDAAQEPPGPVRTCFRLIEPALAGTGLRSAEAAASDSTNWRVQFALQSTDDPSLLLPAADIWSGDTADGWATAGIDYPEDDLLAGLGRASRIFAELDSELQGAAPESVTLDSRGALRFLKETGPLLAGAGFGVLLPGWVRRSRLGLKLTTRSRTSSAPGSAAAPRFGLTDLVDFRYELAVGDQTLDPAELAELARLKVPLVRLRGQWVELDERHLKAALDFLARGGSGTMTAGDALAAGLADGIAELPLTEVDADGWLGDLLSGEAPARLAPMTTPASFGGQLRPYQERGLAWLTFLGGLGLGAVLADDMGLGKSPQTLAAAAGRARRRDGHRPDAADLPHVAGGELAAGGGPVHPAAHGLRASWRGPAGRRRADRGNDVS